MLNPTGGIANKEKAELLQLVGWLLYQKLGKLAPLVTRYLGRTGTRRNMVSIQNTALCSLRYGVSSAAAIASEYFKDLIAAGHLSPDKSYLACDPS